MLIAFENLVEGDRYIKYNLLNIYQFITFTTEESELPYSTGCMKAVSNFEVGLDYRDMNDPIDMICYSHTQSHLNNFRQLCHSRVAGSGLIRRNSCIYE
jgi:hypothetical protein